MLKTLQSGINSWRFIRGIKAIKNADSDEDRLRARQYLTDLLSEQKGLLCKIGQLMSDTGNNEDPLHKLCNQVQALSFDQISAILSDLYDEKTLNSIAIEETPLASASLSQVHRIRLASGETAILKIQYPHIREHVEADLRLLGLLPGIGPVKKWNIDLEGHRSHLKQILERELDYQNEAQQQITYQQQIGSEENIVIPNVLKHLTRNTIIAQEYIPGASLAEASTWNSATRKHIAQSLIKHFFKQLFERHIIHADPHDGNYAFINQSQGDCVILYDFGCLQSIPANQAHALLTLILHAQQRTNSNPLDLYSQIGFDRSKLKHIAPQLPALTQTLFAPFMQNQPFQLRDWNPAKSIKQLLGEHAWYFRSAGPTNGLLILRAFSGLFRQIKALNAFCNWHALLHETCPQLCQTSKEQLSSMQHVHYASFQSLAQHLSIQVTKNGVDTVSLQLPAQVIEDLPSIIDDDIKQHILEKNINIEAIIELARANGYQRQTLFQLTDDKISITVSLV